MLVTPMKPVLYFRTCSLANLSRVAYVFIPTPSIPLLMESALQELKVKSSTKSSVSQSAAVNSAVEQGSKCAYSFADVSSFSDNSSPAVLCTLSPLVSSVLTSHGDTTQAARCKRILNHTPWVYSMLSCPHAVHLALFPLECLVCAILGSGFS